MAASRFAVPVVVAALAVSACAARAPRVPELQPLAEEGELYVYFQPLPADARRISLALGAVSARGTAGTVPLALALPIVSGEGAQHQRLVASGRLPPGRYDGLQLEVAKASVRRAEGMTDLLVPEEVERLDVAFTIERRRAVVVWVSIGEQKPGESEFSFTRSVTAHVAAPPTPQLAGYCAAAGANAIFVFDKHTRQIGAVLPTGGAPMGVSLDSIRGRVYAALQRDDQLQIIDATSREVIVEAPLRPGDAPRELALAQGGTLLFVANEGSNSVSVIDPGTAAEVARVPVDDQPWSLVPERGGARAYVLSRRANTVTAVDAATRSVLATAGTEPEPIRADIDRSGTRLYVVHRGSLYLGVHALPDLVLQRQVFVGAPASFVKVDARTDLIYVALAGEPRVQIYDPLSLVPLTELEVPSPVSYIAIDDVENTMFLVMPRLRAIAVVDLTSRKQLAVLDVGAEPYGVTLAGERH